MKLIAYIIISTLFCVKAQIKLEMGVLNPGFHKTLTYLPSFNGPEYKNCKYFLKQNLPSSVFINCDELNDLRRLNKLNAIYPEHVDVEIPKEKADPLSVIIGDIVSTENESHRINLPIHFRYHTPSTKRFVKVEIDIPLMFLKCSVYNRNKIHIDDFAKYCFNGTDFNSQLPENDFDSNCDWILFPYNLQLLTPLKVNVPVGDIRFYTLVKYLTIFISWIGMICIILTINTKVEKNLNKLQNIKKD